MQVYRLICAAVALLSWVACDDFGSPSPQTGTVLARVDTVEITDADLEAALVKLRVSKTDRSLAQWRRELQTLIDRQLLLMEAQRRGFFDDPSVVKGAERWWRAQVMEKLVAREMRSARGGEEEVRNLFVQSGADREVRVGRLVLADRVRGELALAQARSGRIGFAELQALYLPPQQQSNVGGQLRWFSPLEVRDPRLLSLLQAGTGAVDLIEDDEGYALLFAVAERTVSFEERRELTERTLTHRKRAEANRALIDRFEKKYDIEINPAAVTALSQHPSAQLDTSLVLVHSTLGDRTVGEYLAVLGSFTAPEHGRFDRGRSIEPAILIALVLDRLIEQEAREAGLEESLIERRQTERNRRVIEALWTEDGLNKIAVTGAEIGEYIAANRSRYASELAVPGGTAAVRARATRELKEERARPMFESYIAELRKRYESVISVDEDHFHSFVTRQRREKVPAKGTHYTG